MFSSMKVPVIPESAKGTLLKMYNEFCYYDLNPEKISVEQHKALDDVLSRAKIVLSRAEKRLNLKNEEDLVSEVFAYSGLIEPMLRRALSSKEKVFDQSKLDRIFKLLTEKGEHGNNDLTLVSIQKEVYSTVSDEMLKLAKKIRPFVIDVYGHKNTNKFTLKVVLLWMIMNEGKVMTWKDTLLHHIKCLLSKSKSH
jgi:hypothetical protein